MNLEDKITFQDELDADETRNEYSFSRPWVRWGGVRGFAIFLCLSSLSVLCGVLSSKQTQMLFG